MSKKFTPFFTLTLLIILSFSACGPIKIFNERKNTETKKKELSQQSNLNPENVKPLYTTQVSHKSGTYNEPIRLRFNNENSNAEIFFTTNLNDYSPESFKKYETPILIDEDTEILFFSKTADSQENVQKVSYKIEKKNTDQGQNKMIKDQELNNFINSLKLEPNQE